MKKQGGKERSRGAILTAVVINTQSAYVMRLRIFRKLTLGQSKIHKSSVHILRQHNFLCLRKKRNISTRDDYLLQIPVHF